MNLQSIRVMQSAPGLIPKKAKYNYKQEMDKKAVTRKSKVLATIANNPMITYQELMKFKIAGDSTVRRDIEFFIQDGLVRKMRTSHKTSPMALKVTS